MDIPVLDADVAARFEREQNDLDMLCADRQLVTNEVLQANDFYGIASLLKSYCGYPGGLPVKAVIPHGVTWNDDAIIPYERTARLPAVLCYPPYRYELYRRETGMAVIPSPAPFVYACKMVEELHPREGTLFFPAHSSHRVTADSDYEALAEKLLSWPEERGPVSVMIYWRDYLLGHHLPFAKRGIPLVSAGHMFDPDFLLRQAHLMKKHRHVAGNGVGSHLFYALATGCTAQFVEHDYLHTGDVAHLVHDAPALSPPRVSDVAAVKRVFSEEREAPSGEQLRLMRHYIGTDLALEPRDLYDLLTWIETLDRRGPLLGIGSGVSRFGVLRPTRSSPVPSLWRRSATTVMVGIRGAVSRTIALLRRLFPFLRDVRLRKRSS